MIKIEERQPIKFSGLSSIFLSFPYNQEAINTIKTCNQYAYNKKTFEWETPVTELAYLLDELTYLDDIELHLMKDASDVVHYYPKLVDKYKSKPYKHQLEGIEWFLNKDCGLLLDDPGLGKTLQMIYLAMELREQKGLQHCLIICGVNSLKQNWKSEIRKHSDLSCRVIGEKISRNGKLSYASTKERAAELYNPLDAFFYILNIESLRSDDIITAIKTSKNKIDMIILDECHKCANPNSQQSHGLIKLKNYRHKIGLTGTLLTNTPLNCYLPLKWIDVEKATFTNFKNQYCSFGGFGNHELVGYKNLDVLKAEIESCALRRKKDILTDLPPKTVIKEILEMNDDHRKFYENIVDGVKEECDKIDLKSNNVLALTTRLRQATACPAMLTSSPIESTKLQRAVELVEELTSRGEKVVIMSIFKEPINQLARLLQDYKPLIGTGDVDDGQVERNKELFQTDDEHMVFLATESRMGTGHTLNRAPYMILIDTPWTFALTDQVEDRIHRIGTKEHVFIYRLICQGTIDETVDQIVELKEALSDFVIDDKITENGMVILRQYIEDL